MWRRLVAPEVLFLFGGIQSLLPFLLWRIDGPYPYYTYSISYIPLVIWIAGYTAFWIGASSARRPRFARVADFPRITRFHRGLMVIVIVALWVQIAGFYRIYGGVPFLLYLSGRADASVTETLTMTNAVSGQLGLFLESQLLLDGLIVITIASVRRQGRRYPILVALGIITSIVAALSTGKRQSAAILFVMLMISGAIYFGNPLRPLLRYFGFRHSKKWLSRILFVALPLSFVAFIGFMVQLRTGTQVTGQEQILATFHIGLINLETQVEEAGYGPKRWNLLRLTQYMIPDRLLRQIPSFAEDPPFHAEPTASAGFYGDLHWNAGMPGIILFSFLVGWISKAFYFRAPSSAFHLVTYSLMSWTLIAAHSYNHFLHLNFLLLPTVIYWLITRVRPSRLRYRVARHLSPLPAGAH